MLIGKAMRKGGMVPDRVLCSAAARTRETWALAAPELNAEPGVAFTEALYLAPWKAIVNLGPKDRRRRRHAADRRPQSRHGRLRRRAAAPHRGRGRTGAARIAGRQVSHRRARHHRLRHCALARSGARLAAHWPRSYGRKISNRQRSVLPCLQGDHPSAPPTQPWQTGCAIRPRTMRVRQVPDAASQTPFPVPHRP